MWRKMQELVDALREQAPRSILDVGCGPGHIGAALRYYLEGPKFRRDVHDRFDVSGHDLMLVGVEPWIQQQNPTWRTYNLVFIGHILGYLQWSRSQQQFDAILLLDVLEHLDPLEEQFALLRERLSPAGVLYATLSRDRYDPPGSLYTRKRTLEVDDLLAMGFPDILSLEPVTVRWAR